ncbi:MAG: hypothetical protein ACTS5I_10130 [Rhodanobacter sp.]
MSTTFDPLMRLMSCLKSLRAEQTKAFNAGAKSGDLYAGYTDKQRARYGEIARDCAIHIRRLKHEAHCLAVELGIADLRDESHYTPVTAPAGFGRETLIERRRPNT